ncbi:MAG TPA: peptide chain release factor N(5)-glutamine methyltransferase [Rubricoccaceae bacterium]|nr:peptide chain release factor N(5)-glutamine methyltransferase [Rubricoccaceae bacterium]
MTRHALLENAVARLEGAGVEDARRNVEWLLEEVLGVNRAALYAHPHEPVPDEAHAAFEGLLARRLRREPVQYVLGHADFCGLRLRVTPAVLIPRPETEEVAEEALRRLAAVERPWVLDVGTGSGALALALKHRRPDAEVFACDVSEAALAVAADNAVVLGLQLTFVLADVLDPAFAHAAPPTFDLIVANPPYVPTKDRETLAPEVIEHEPPTALFVDDADPLVFYRALARLAPRLLKPGGCLVVETHADYGEAVRALFAEAGLADPMLRRDLAGRPRIVGAWLAS